MKLAASALALSALFLVATSCDKHSWEETQVLHEGMHKAHGDGHHGGAHHAEGAVEAKAGDREVHHAKPSDAPAPGQVPPQTPSNNPGHAPTAPAAKH